MNVIEGDCGSVLTIISTSDHLLCDQTSPDGCSFCRPQPLTICCDLCHPNFFAPYRVPPATNTRGPNKTRAPDYEMTQTDATFRNVLLQRRHSTSLFELGAFLLRDYGAKFILPDDTLDHIVNCFHRETITIPEQLSHKTDGLADEYSTAIFALIDEHTLKPPPEVVYSAGMIRKKKGSAKGKGKENDNENNKPTRALQTCGGCGAIGHNRERQYALS